eukprot:4756267-Pleurochrysis_carterae.AAC.3
MQKCVGQGDIHQSFIKHALSCCLQRRISSAAMGGSDPEIAGSRAFSTNLRNCDLATDGSPRSSTLMSPRRRAPARSSIRKHVRCACGGGARLCNLHRETLAEAADQTLAGGCTFRKSGESDRTWKAANLGIGKLVAKISWPGICGERLCGAVTVAGKGAHRRPVPSSRQRRGGRRQPSSPKSKGQPQREIRRARDAREEPSH